MSPPPPPPPPPPHNPFPRALFFGTKVLPAIFILGAVQIAVTNYVNPMTDEQRAEIEQRRKGVGFSNSRASKKNVAIEKRKQDLLSHDDSNVLSPDNMEDIDLSHLERSGLGDIATESAWTQDGGDSSSGSSR